MAHIPLTLCYAVFQECISKSAVKTKFEMHAARGKTIASDLRTIMDAVYSNAVHKK